MDTYHCGNCHEKHTNLENKVNTYNKTNVFQCDKCWFVDPVIIRDYGMECTICMENTNDLYYVKCGHSICQTCINQLNDFYTCPYCKITGSVSYISCGDDDYDYYFESLPTIKPYMKQLYCNIVDDFKDNVNAYNGLYTLLVCYYKFLTVLHEYDNNNQALKLSPPNLIDQVWHHHLLDNSNYIRVCNLIGGYVLYHYPTNSFKYAEKNKKEQYELAVKLYQNKYTLIRWVFCDNKEDIMSIFVKTLSGSTVIIEVKNDFLIDEVKQMIDNKTGMKTKLQRLIFNGKSMMDERMVKDYNLTPGCTLHLVTRLRGC